MYLHIWLPFSLWAFKLKFFCWQQKSVEVFNQIPCWCRCKCCTNFHKILSDTTHRNQRWRYKKWTKRRNLSLFNRHYWVCRALNSILSRILDKTWKEILDMSHKVRIQLSNDNTQYIFIITQNEFSSHLNEASHSNLTAICHTSASLLNKIFFTFPTWRCKLKITINIFTQE